MSNLSDELRAIAEAAIRAGIPSVQFVSPQLIIGGLQELEAENKALKGQIKLMDTKARGSFNCFWNGGWYSLDSYTPPKEVSGDE